jgi:hypothetical protein
MTPFQVGAEVGTTMTRLTKTLRTATKEAMTDAGKVAKQELEAQGKRRTGDLRFSNMGGARLAVRLRPTDADLTVSPRGPWGMLEPGAKPHAITSKRPMRIGNTVRWGPFKHPGTPNTRAWSTGRDETFERLGREVPKQIGDKVEGVFNG